MKICGSAANIEEYCRLIKAASDTEKIANLADSINILSPQSTLRRGYSITTANGKAVKSASQILPGTVITTHLADGSIDSTVN